MNKFNISVVDLALPSPRIGSIDTYSGFGSTTKLAMKAHQKFQLKQQEHPNYCSEVPILYTIKFKRHVFTITGRIDGIYEDNPFRIEEIKTAFEPTKLIDTLAQNYFTHPYWLQLQIYGYIHWLKTKTMPSLNLLIISLRDNKKTYSLPLDFNIEAFEQWLENRLAELVGEIKESKKRITRRKVVSTQCIFPFEQPRPHQHELIDSINKTMKQKKPMLIQAPTGLGKTLGVLFPALKESLNRGQKTIYITPKNSQHQIALNTVHLLQSKGAACKSLMLTAKKKLCMKNEPICSSKQCEFAESHYTKCTTNNLLKKAQKKEHLDQSFFKKMAERYQICPYELQMNCIPFVDVVIGDYNYVFSSNNTNSRVCTLPLGEMEQANLVIDEVHNLPSRGMDYYSPTLEVKFFEYYLHALEKYPHLFKEQLSKRISECIKLIHQCALPNARGPHKVTLSEQAFKQQEERLNQLLTDYLESDLTIEANDPILKLCSYWSDFTQAIEFVNEGKEEFFISFNPMNDTLKISCYDASSFLKEHYSSFQHVIGFSATLKPFSYYSQLIGLRGSNLHTEEFSTPFCPDNRKLLIIPQVSTKYRDREANYSKMVEVITRITALKEGNYFIFFPSFDFLDKIFQRMPPTTFSLLRQERSMNLKDTNNLLAQLHQKNKPHLFFAVQGGSFAEGIDYVGELAIGAFIVGPPLPNYDWEREQMKHYYEKRYQAGQEYAYIYPAMAKAIQAAGRVIRTETDKGLIVLLDNRFLDPKYSQCMPKDWFGERPQELVSTAIINDIKAFWERVDAIPTPPFDIIPEVI